VARTRIEDEPVVPADVTLIRQPFEPLFGEASNTPADCPPTRLQLKLAAGINASEHPLQAVLYVFEVL
jgi:hypothetical protein